MTVTTQQEGTALTIAVEGILNTNTAPELKAVLEEKLPGVTDLTFDFEKLQYLSSAGLRVLLSAMQTMDDQGTLKVIHVGDLVREILDQTGFLDDLNVEE